MKAPRLKPCRLTAAAALLFTLSLSLASAAPSPDAQTNGATASTAARQTPTPRDAAPAQTPAPPPAAQPSVLLNFIALDASGRALDDLRREDVRLTEDGAPQTVTYFARDESPLACGLLVDRSGSMRHTLGAMTDFLKAFVAGSRAGDESFVETFVSSDKIEIGEDFTSDRDTLSNALDSIYIEGGQTAIVDAVYAGAQHAAERAAKEKRPRAALLLVTDGEDRGSSHKLEDLKELLRRTGVQVFAVGLVGELDPVGGFTHLSQRDKAKELLEAIARESGGRAFFPKSLSDLTNLSSELSRAVHTQYVVGYTPTNAAADGKFHKIEIKLANDPHGSRRFTAARPGYLATGRDAAAK